MTFIFITDLDGTLLGHSHFDFEQIKSDVTGLLDTGHLLVLASSKTKAEVESFCNALGRKVPFIYEMVQVLKILTYLSNARRRRICDKIQKLLELMRY